MTLFMHRHQGDGLGMVGTVLKTMLMLHMHDSIIYHIHYVYHKQIMCIYMCIFTCIGKRLRLTHALVYICIQIYLSTFSELLINNKDLIWLQKTVNFVNNEQWTAFKE